jgi:hypothetical protein
MHILPPSPATITVGHFDHLTIILDLQQLYYITILLTCQHFCSAAAIRLPSANSIDPVGSWGVQAFMCKKQKIL